MVKLDKQQSQVVKSWAAGSSLAVNAVAGSGKTSVALALQKVTASPILYVAFTNAAKGEILSRKPGLQVRTTYSLGYGALSQSYGDLTLDKDKYFKIVEAYMGQVEGKLLRLGVRRNTSKWGYTNRLLTDAVRMSLLSLEIEEPPVENLYRVASEIAPARDESERLAEVLIDGWLHATKEGYKVFLDEGIVDFTDQVALPCLLPDVQFTQYQKIVVDEGQDLSVAQRTVVFCSLAEGGQIAVVGDPNQSIFIFAGASFNSFSEFVDEGSLECLSINRNYRCGRSIIELAQGYVPHIQAHDGAEQGEVVAGCPGSSDLGKGLMVLSRWHWELIETSLKIIDKGVPFEYSGSQLYSKLSGALIKYSDKSIGNLPRHVEKWEAGNPDADSHTLDMNRALLALWERLKPKSERGFKTGIRNLLSTSTKGAKVRLSTVHAAKGKESDKVWFMSLDRDREGSLEYVRQEDNLDYVGITRAKRTLFTGGLAQWQ